MRFSVRAGTIRLLSVTAVAATACALTAGAASAATAKAAPKHATHAKVFAVSRAYVGASVKLSATVTGAGSRPTGKVVFWLGSRKLCHASLSKGSAHCNASFSTAAYKKITAKYGGNSTHKASSGSRHVNIVRSATTTKITKITPDPVKDGVSAIVTVAVTSAGGTPAATGTVSVAPTNVVGSTAGYTCSATLVRGTGSCIVTPPTPSYGLIDFKATYAGNAAHTGSSSAASVLPVQETTTTTVGSQASSAGDVTVTATVVSAGEANLAPPGGTGSVSFYLGSADTPVAGCEAITLANSGGADNVATCTGSSTLNGLTAGSYTITAIYSGDDVNLTSTSAPGTLSLS
jgi:hypothetical protein